MSKSEFGKLINTICDLKIKSARANLLLAKQNMKMQIEEINKEMQDFTKECELRTYKLCHFSKLYSETTLEEKENILNYYKSQMKDKYPYDFTETEPITLDDFKKRQGFHFMLPGLKNIFPKLYNKQENRKKELKENYDLYLLEFQMEEEKRKNDYLQNLEQKNQEIENFNHKLSVREQNFFNNNEYETEFMVKNALTDIVISFGEKDYTISDDVTFYKEEHILDVTIHLMSPIIFKDLPKSGKFKKSILNVEYKYYSETELNKIYTALVENIVLIRLYEISFTFQDYISFININAKIHEKNPLNGIPEDINVLSVKVPCNEFSKIHVKYVDPLLVLKNYGAKISKNMINLLSVPTIDYIQKDLKVTDCNIKNIHSHLDGFQFEKFSSELLLANGFNSVEVTKASGDYGADVIAYKDDIKYAIQCKNFSSAVGVKAVQEVIGSLSIYNCHVGVVLTNNYFTPSAKELAVKNNILLWDADKLILMLNNLKLKNK